MTHLISRVKILMTANNINYEMFTVAALKMTPGPFDILPLDMWVLCPVHLNLVSLTGLIDFVPLTMKMANFWTQVLKMMLSLPAFWDTDPMLWRNYMQKCCSPQRHFKSCINHQTWKWVGLNIIATSSHSVIPSCVLPKLTFQGTEMNSLKCKYMRKINDCNYCKPLHWGCFFI